MTSRAALQQSGQVWRWTLAFGVLTIFLAAVALLLPIINWAPRGGLVGWLLFLAGAMELLLGSKRGSGAAGGAALGSGFITALAGLLFIANPLADYLPVANLVMGWLLLRGAWMFAMALRVRCARLRPWLALNAAADMLLGLALLIGLQITMLVVLLFGPTREIVAQFALILAASFLVTGISQLAIGLVERRVSRSAREEHGD